MSKHTEKTAVYNSKIGLIQLFCTDEYIYRLKFISKEQTNIASEPNELSNLANLQIQEYLAGKRKVFDLPLELKGTDFQKRVWQALCGIPYGETRSYKQIAETIGNHKAARAVGMANNKNPIPIIIPCHRVIGSNGNLVGYAGGLNLKKILLNLEQKKIKS